MTVKASQVVDWTKRDYVFTPVDEGRQGRLVSWGRSPNVGDVLALRNGDGASCYQVTEWHPTPGADVYTLKLRFIRGSDIEDDR